MPGPLVIFGNPPRSEYWAWELVKKLSRRISGTGINQQTKDDLQNIATVMLRQLAEGVHLNPRGHTKRVKIGSHVQAVVYVHAKDGGQYVHGFGDAALNERDLARGVLQLSELKARTHVEMFGEPEGTITLAGTKGQPLSALFT